MRVGGSDRQRVGGSDRQRGWGRGQGVGCGGEGAVSGSGGCIGEGTWGGQVGECKGIVDWQGLQAEGVCNAVLCCCCLLPLHGQGVEQLL